MKARHPRLAVGTVIAEGLLGRLAFGMISFALPLYALQLGLSLAEIGFLVSARTIVALMTKPLAGLAADRVGVRAVYLVGTIGRSVAVVGLLAFHDPAGLLMVRVLQGLSASGRDVASLSVIARDAENRIGSAYSWYTTAKHVGGVGGAAIAGLILSATHGSFSTLFSVVLVLSGLPLVAAWIGLQEVATSDSEQTAPMSAERQSRLAGAQALLRELGGPASVAMLVTTSAYMVHGIFPILATEYAGLTEAETGLIYSLSAAVVLISGPLAGWLVDRRGPSSSIAWRSIANIGSSFLYLASPTLPGIAVARAVDDSGKAVFRPAWATAIARIAAVDPARRGQRLGALDASQNAGEIVGPILAGLLWHSGGVVALFGVRIVIAAAAELAALRVFHGKTAGESNGGQGRVRAASSNAVDAGPQPTR